MKWLWKLLGIYKENILIKETFVPPPQKPLNIGDKVTIHYFIKSEEGIIAGEPFYSQRLKGIIDNWDWYIPVRTIAGVIENPPLYLVHKIEL